jgi:hypothetical protein
VRSAATVPNAPYDDTSRNLSKDAFITWSLLSRFRTTWEDGGGVRLGRGRGSERSERKRKDGGRERSESNRRTLLELRSRKRRRSRATRPQEEHVLGAPLGQEKEAVGREREGKRRSLFGRERERSEC